METFLLRYSLPARLIPLLAMLSCGSWGCIVSQPAGKGRQMLRTEPTTGTAYYLYLPQDYVESEGHRSPDKKWPIVVSFHGMRPFDSAGAQIKEWQQEADRYGYVVVAPDTRVSDLLGELPLRRVSPSLERDSLALEAILDEMYRTLDVDPNHVLSTSWSMGGYLAHYMINRFPRRFSCVAVRQSNFSAEILDERKIPEYHDAKIAVFYTQNDFSIVRNESQKAIAWYKRRGFDTTSGIVDSMGHERTPQTAAAFFATTCNAEAKTPLTTLARITMTSTPGNPMRSRGSTAAGRLAMGSTPRLNQDQGRLAGTKPSRRPRTTDQSSSSASSTSHNRRFAPPRSRGPAIRDVAQRSSPDGKGDRQTRAAGRTTKDRIVPPKEGPGSAAAARNEPLITQPIAPTTEKRLPPPVKSKPIRRTSEIAINPLEVRVSAYIGISPMLISYTVQLPSDLRENSDVLWLDNGRPISHGISGQKSLGEPGRHKIEVWVVADDNREYRAAKTVTVLERLSLDSED